MILMGVYLLGVTKGYYQRITAHNFGLVFGQEFGSQESRLPNFGLYETVLDLVDDKYYGDVNYVDVLYGTIKGAVAAIGDAYTSFNTPEENRAFFDSLDSIYEGVGVEIDYIGDRLFVVSAIDGTPAKVAGLKPKDEILAVDGIGVQGLYIDEVVGMIQGPRGSEVILTVYREGFREPLDITIKREVIRVQSVTVSVKDGIANIRVSKFASDTQRLFNRAVDEIIRVGAKAVVLDLRDNPGGFLDVGVNVANEFLDGGLIVEERFKNGEVIPFSADGNGRLANLPVAVLVNGGSASASEIVAGALQDNQRATIIGEHTYGKGSVQEIEEFIDGSSLRVTVAHWFTPNGISISEAGVKPDIVIGGEAEDNLADVALAKAIEVLTQALNESNS